MGKVIVNRNFKRELVRPENTREWQRKVGTAGLAAIRAHSPVNYGTLQASWFSHVHYDGRTTRVIFGSRLPDARAVYQEVGTGLYGPMHRWITPKRAKALRWFDNRPGVPGGPSPTGAVHFAKRVRGSPPQLYMATAMRELFGFDQVISYAPIGGRRRRMPPANTV